LRRCVYADGGGHQNMAADFVCATGAPSSLGDAPIVTAVLRRSIFLDLFVRRT